MLSLPSHLVYFFLVFILHYSSGFDCKFIWKNYVIFSFIEFIFVMVKDTYLLKQIGDYVDRGPSSDAAKCTFHRTSISVYHRNERNLPHKKFIYENKAHFKSTMPEFPKNCTNIMPAKRGKLKFPSNKLLSESFFPSESETRSEATAWLEALRESVEDTIIQLFFQHFFSGNLNSYQNIYQTYLPCYHCFPNQSIQQL